MFIQKQVSYALVIEHHQIRYHCKRFSKPEKTLEYQVLLTERRIIYRYVPVLRLIFKKVSTCFTDMRMYYIISFFLKDSYKLAVSRTERTPYSTLTMFFFSVKVRFREIWKYYVYQFRRSIKFIVYCIRVIK